MKNFNSNFNLAVDVLSDGLKDDQKVNLKNALFRSIEEVFFRASLNVTSSDKDPLITASSAVSFLCFDSDKDL